MNGKQVCSVCLNELKKDDLIVRNAKDPSGGLVWNKNGDMQLRVIKKEKEVL